MNNFPNGPDNYRGYNNRGHLTKINKTIYTGKYPNQKNLW